MARYEIKKLLHLDGLRLRSFVDMSKTLQGKWIWRFMIENCTLWRRVIKAKFGIADRGCQGGGKRFW